jgi:hypothetical protein
VATERKLRYAERKKLAETGSLGDLVHDEVPPKFRTALWYMLFQPQSKARERYIESVELLARPYFGWPGGENTTTFVATASTDDLLSFVEIARERAGHSYNNTAYSERPHRKDVLVLSDFEERFNHLCERHRFGYRIENGNVHMVGSPVLEREVVGPALLAVQRPGWDQVEKSFREALNHQRGGETDDALTAAHAAVEAALKAVGMSGPFTMMTKQFRSSALVPSYLQKTPDALDSFIGLLARSNAVRSAAGDAHGKVSGSDEVPQALADLAIHWAGAFIVFLAESTR